MSTESETMFEDMNASVERLNAWLDSAKHKRIAAQRAELEALPDDHWRKLKHQMATDKRQRPHCGDCITMSHDIVCGAYAFECLMKGEKTIRTNSPDFQAFLAEHALEELGRLGGYGVYCSDCKAKGPLTFEWIADIPFEAFKAFQIDQLGACYVIDDMKGLLPVDAPPPKQYVDNGPSKYNFPVEFACKTGYEKGDFELPKTLALVQKPGGGFEFL